ncbi:S-adenosyl-L-methionine-dependent methyltransferase [Apodospora peruviana]|uniref:S-adenosyl-L-methionine-dependent methyltransferase n=1 Tax=Apodospora peruviana TaxID=516989 RepID=A0AAE0MED3_9PEZI|nr:S-adenosyl-L-methionine-dependent methyltransferase [Apodospora peruviana]
MAYPSASRPNNGPDLAPFSGMATVLPRRGVEGFRENGRFYGACQRGEYPFPYDEDEKERLDIFHKIFCIARKDVFYNVPIYDQAPRILDLGCGTGIWGIDVADKLPKGEVLGVDLALIQPEYIPENIRFDQMDIEEPWQDMRPGSWDVIHMRTLCGSIRNWQHLYAEISRHLKPQIGFLEQVEIDWVPRSHDGSVSPNSVVSQWAEELMLATEKLGRPMRLNSEFIKQRMMAAGLVDFKEEIIMIPLNGWPSDPHTRELGRWFNLGLKQGIHALTVAPLCRAHNRSPEQVIDLINRVTEEIHSRQLRGYCNLHIFTARRP